MLRWLAKMLGLAVFIVVGSTAIWYYQDHYSSQHELEQVQEKNRVLTRMVQRLSDEKRVAQVLVMDSKTVNGVLHQTLLFVEDDRNGDPLPPKSFEIEGTEAHFDALVIKFEHEFVSKGDPLRGHSIALFTRVYGDKQSPATAFPIDEPGKIPDIYRGSDPKVSEFEQELWKNFWRLADDPEYARQMGVRIANGQGVWGPFEPDKVYTITLEAAGGLNLTSEPLKGIYRAALRDRVKIPTTAQSR
jgi:hypothetical protein